MVKAKYILLLSVLSISLHGQAAQKWIDSGRPVDQKADSVFEHVSKEMDILTKAKEKFKAVQTAIGQLKNMLSQAVESTPDQLEHVKNYIEALQTLPKQAQKKSKSCDQYEVHERVKDLLPKLLNCSQSS